MPKTKANKDQIIKAIKRSLSWLQNRKLTGGGKHKRNQLPPLPVFIPPPAGSTQPYMDPRWLPLPPRRKQRPDNEPTPLSSRESPPKGPEIPEWFGVSAPPRRRQRVSDERVTDIIDSIIAQL